jgi:hypothetical protein
MARRGKVVSRCADEQPVTSAALSHGGGLMDGRRGAQGRAAHRGCAFCMTED